MSDFPTDWEEASVDEQAAKEFVLHDLVEAGDTVNLSALLSKGMKDGDFDPAVEEEEEEQDELDLDERDMNDCTPLHIALLTGKLECAQLLLDSGAEIFIRCEGSPALHVAVSVGQLPSHSDFSCKAMQLLLGFSADAVARDDYGRHALHLCCMHGLEQQAQILLEGGAEECIYTADFDGLLPIHTAAQYAQPRMVQFLLERGADGSACAPYARTPLHFAASAGCEETATILLKHSPALRLCPDHWGVTPCGIARRSSNRGRLVSLLETESDESTQEYVWEEEMMPMHSAHAWQCRTLVIAPKECHLHQTCPWPVPRQGEEPPPENDTRLDVLTNPESGILRCAALQQKVEWAETCKPAPMADVLRVHEYSYVRRVLEQCGRLAVLPPFTIGHLDGDTAISRGSFDAALHAAGAVIEAIDQVVIGKKTNVFCAVRPPGHHAGPKGVVTCGNDPHGSHGFCLLNNVAIGAAYARCVLRHRGIERVAIVDFDVHHGNGTQACVAATVPTMRRVPFSTDAITGTLNVPCWKPWLDNNDPSAIFFASSQGYGSKGDEGEAWFYPGSGGT
ncbi:hypothetical protein CYMTET_31855, partial [Cymbomonas tetramitiformis]